MLFWGEDLVHAPGGMPGTNPALHASIGLTILALSVIRLVWRLINPPPEDVPMPAWQRRLAHALHWLFYALLILIPLSGMAAWDRGIAGRHSEYANLTYFGTFTIPHYPLVWFGEAHKIFTKLAIGLLALHVAAALKHQFIDKDRLINRMSLL